MGIYISVLFQPYNRIYAIMRVFVMLTYNYLFSGTYRNCFVYADLYRKKDDTYQTGCMMRVIICSDVLMIVCYQNTNVLPKHNI